MRRVVVFFLVMALCLSGAARVAADAAPLQPAGRTLVPKGETNVRMVEESVTIDVTYYPAGTDVWSEDAPGDRHSLSHPPYAGHVKAAFIFEAPRPEALLVGFPLGHLLGDGLFAGPVSDFHCLVDGRATSHTVDQVRQAEGPTETWATWQVAFPKGQTRIDVEYRVPFEVYRPWADPSFWYVLSTGRYWAGNIQRATVSLGLFGQGIMLPIGPADVRERTTKGWRISDGRLVWEFKEIEPDFDMVATIRPLAYLDLLGKVLETARGAEPSGPVAGVDASQAARFVSRLVMSVDSETCMEAGLRPEDMERLWPLGVSLYKQARSSSNDEALHLSYYFLLGAWPGTDKDPGLLSDYLAEEVRSYTMQDKPRLLDEVTRDRVSRRAVRLCALGGEGIVPTVVQALGELSMTPEDVGQEIDWRRDVSGLAPAALKKAQEGLRMALPGGDGPETARGATATGVLAVIAAGTILAVCMALVLARARGRRTR
ncbi:MAG: hypothetical protein Q8P50_08200 [Bacillota bacterium]|nr:hypothetical protein [Bacillota bacterium]